ncbi:flagellar basal-body rod protein FlgF [Yunchengibacter salinarum]|uniref:flagellar basal-body rod protein FlgF n=1 Tax=Yunchengibacter salinarum TaxID=3133399 RepID=UPI0035B63926
MDTSLLLGLSQRAALRRKMDVIANNIANMSTTAYKKENVVFRQHLMDAKNAEGTMGGKLSYVMDHGVTRDMKAGDMQHTGNPLDVFISGPGYLNVENAQGEERYTRNGKLTIDNESFLVTLNGDRVLDDNGQPIQFDPDDTDITITKDGTISSRLGEVARLGLSTFANQAALKREGASLYKTDQAPEPADFPEVQVVQGAVEQSNIDAIKSFVEMTKVMKEYQSSSRNESGINEMRQDAIDRLAQVR